MTTLSIQLPDSLRQLLEEQAAKCGYATTDAYVEALIRDDLKRRYDAALEEKLLEGLNSGPASEMTAGEWEEIRHTILDRHSKRER